MHWSVLALAVTGCVVCATVPLAAIWVSLLMLELPDRRPRRPVEPPRPVPVPEIAGGPALQGEPRDRVERAPRQQVVGYGEAASHGGIDEAVDPRDVARTEQWLQEVIAARQLEDW